MKCAVCSFFLKICLFIGTFSAGASLQDALLFYEDCDDRKSSYPDVQIAAALPPEAGKFGHALRLRRRLLNQAVNGDFEFSIAGNWMIDGDGKRMPLEGVDGDSCLLLERGATAVLPIPWLYSERIHSISFAARSQQIDIDEKPSVSVEWLAGGELTELLEPEPVDSDFRRFQAAVFCTEDYGTLRIHAIGGTVILDQVAMHEGDNHEASFTPPLKKVSRDGIFLPPSYVDVKSGAFSCWVKVPWIRPDFESRHGHGFFQVAADRPPKLKNKPYNVLGAICWLSSNRSTYLTVAGSDDSSVGISFDLDDISSFKEEWHHFVFNWKFSNSKILLEIFVDGKQRSFSEEMLSGMRGPVSEVLIGFDAGCYLNGVIDDVAFFNRPLSTQEIVTVFNSDIALAKLLQNLSGAEQ